MASKSFLSPPSVVPADGYSFCSEEDSAGRHVPQHRLHPRPGKSSKCPPLSGGQGFREQEQALGVRKLGGAANLVLGTHLKAG